jgi:hypothetical protein
MNVTYSVDSKEGSISDYCEHENELTVFINPGNFLSSSVTISFVRKTMLRGLTSCSPTLKGTISQIRTYAAVLC